MKGALAAAVTQPIIEINWCNTNGAANSPGHSSGGGIYRDHHEMHSTIKAIFLAFKKGWIRIWLGCDSTLVMDNFNVKTNVPWKLQNYWLTCKTKIALMDFKISHIYREGNNYTNKLASHGMIFRRNCIWNSMPSLLREDYNRNRFGLQNYRFCNM
ncbi:hypothetical protein Lal_00029679 [Lupinus albus]|nr:hypothetical protein Lal_00029679 [Lupinus albus]